MQTVGIFEAKTKLSELLRSGEVIHITSHRRTVGKLYPAFEETPEFIAEAKRQLAIINLADAADNWEDYADFPEDAA